jgi:transcriptional regulator
VYIPEFNRIEDRAASLAFMKANPFAILVTSSHNGPLASHLPLLVEEKADRIILRGHFAKANHHWSGLEQEHESLVIFHGPHAYISPSLYEVRESVPTWNYAAVHVYGKGRLIKETVDAERILADLIAQFDPSYYQQWLTFSAEYRDKMLRRIVAFELEATRIETKFKLGQNRTPAEQQNLMQALECSPDTSVSGLAALMRQQKLGRS